MRTHHTDPAQLQLLEGGMSAEATPAPATAPPAPDPSRHPSAWRLDDRTRTVGRRGVAEVLATLHRATPPTPLHGHRRAS